MILKEVNANMNDDDSDVSAASALSERESNDVEQQEIILPPIGSIDVPATNETPGTDQDSQNQHNDGAQAILDVVAKRSQLARHDIESGNRAEGTKNLEDEKEQPSVAVGIPSREPRCASSKVGAVAIASADLESEKEAQEREKTIVSGSTKSSHTASTRQSSSSMNQDTTIGGQVGGDIDEDILQRTRAEQPGAHAMSTALGEGGNLVEHQREVTINEANVDHDDETYFPAVLVLDNPVAVENGSTAVIDGQSNGITFPQAIVESNVEGSNPEQGTAEGKTQPGTGRKTRIMLCGIAVMVAVIVLLILGLTGVFKGESGSNNSSERQENPSNENSATGSSGRPLSTLELIKKNQVLRCSYTEFIVTDFEKALCESLAAAVLGNKSKMEFVPTVGMRHSRRFLQLANREIDVIARVVTHTMEREVYNIDTKSGFAFAAKPYLYEGTLIAGTPFYVNNCTDNGLKHINECSGLRICVGRNSTQEKALLKYIPARYLISWDFIDDLSAKLNNGTCNTVAGERHSLSETIFRLYGYRGEFALGRNYFSKEPIAFVTRADDAEFADFVSSVLDALLAAEKYNITQDQAKTFPQTSVFGEEYKDMFRNAISANGHFGEVYERNMALVPRDDFNTINNNTGLLFSHPFGFIESERESSTLDASMQSILTRKTLRCGVRDLVGVSGMGRDYCFGLAAALFKGNSTEDIELISFKHPGDGFQLLADNSVDVIVGVPRTLQNDVREPTTEMGFSFSPPFYYGYSVDDDNLCLATRQDKGTDWPNFVYWSVSATIFAEEEGINSATSNSMPLVYVYGEEFKRMFRNLILFAGSYSEMYEKHMEALFPRTGRNMLNTNHPNPGPQHYILPGFFDGAL